MNTVRPIWTGIRDWNVFQVLANILLPFSRIRRVRRFLSVLIQDVSLFNDVLYGMQVSVVILIIGSYQIKYLKPWIVPFQGYLYITQKDEVDGYRGAIQAEFYSIRKSCYCNCVKHGVILKQQEDQVKLLGLCLEGEWLAASKIGSTQPA